MTYENFIINNLILIPHLLINNILKLKKSSNAIKA